MTTLLVALVLLFTILGALAFGVILGYYAIAFILHAMHRHSRPVHEPALVASHGSGAD